MDKSYKRAIEILNISRRHRRPSGKLSGSLPGLDQEPGLSGNADLRGTPSISGMRQWLDELGHSAADINKLNVIHVAGTKGKGSTCAFIDSLLRAHGKRTGFPRKTGLYTSPHLIYPEERIRINFEPLPSEVFAKYFFEVYDALSSAQTQSFYTKPRYLQLFLLVSLHTFIKEDVDVVILETHHGGTYDSTNIVEKPIITVITTLGMDHVKQLGPSIENIAWHKAGIFKSGAPAFSAPQETSVSEVLRSRAYEKAVTLQFIDDDSSLPTDALQLQPDVQRTNCSVAVAAVRSFLDQKSGEKCSPLSSSDVYQGVNQFSWPGRFQLVIENNFHWFLDGAHNEMSVVKAAEWFMATSKIKMIASPVVRILVFSQITDQRDELAVFERLATSLTACEMQYLILTKYERGQNFDGRVGTVGTPIANSSFEQHTKMLGVHSEDVYTEIWKRTQPDTQIRFEPTIQGALETAREIGKRHGNMQSLITGSLGVVGGALSFLQT